jgi:hypothetical protein
MNAEMIKINNQLIERYWYVSRKRKLAKRDRVMRKLWRHEQRKIKKVFKKIFAKPIDKSTIL